MSMAWQRVEKIERIVLHHSASRRGVKAGTIRRWHLNKGWSDIGYHFVVHENGTIKTGRPVDRVPAAQLGKNRWTVAVCIVGDNTHPDRNWLPAQRNAVRRIVAALDLVLPQKCAILGHADLMPAGYTECPGIDVNESSWRKTA